MPARNSELSERVALHVCGCDVTCSMPVRLCGSAGAPHRPKVFSHSPSERQAVLWKDGREVVLVPFSHCGPMVAGLFKIRQNHQASLGQIPHIGTGHLRADIPFHVRLCRCGGGASGGECERTRSSEPAVHGSTLSVLCRVQCGGGSFMAPPKRSGPAVGTTFPSSTAV